MLGWCSNHSVEGTTDKQTDMQKTALALRVMKGPVTRVVREGFLEERHLCGGGLDTSEHLPSWMQKLPYAVTAAGSGPGRAGAGPGGCLGPRARAWSRGSGRGGVAMGVAWRLRARGVVGRLGARRRGGQRGLRA